MTPLNGLTGGSALVAIPGLLTFGDGVSIHILTLFAVFSGTIVVSSFIVTRLARVLLKR